MARRSPPLARRCVAKEWRSACGVAVGGQPERRAEPLHRALHDARVERAALGAEEERAVRPRLPGTEAEILGDRRDDGGEHRDDALLAALAGDAERIAGARAAPRRARARAPRRCGDRSRRGERRSPRSAPRSTARRRATGRDRRPSAPPPAKAAGAGCASGAAAGWRGRRRRWRRPRARGSGSASGCRRCRGRWCATRRRPCAARR